jgi:hypothetical protein
LKGDFLLISSKSFKVSIEFFKEIALLGESETYELEFYYLMNDLACQATDLYFELSLRNEIRSDFILFNTYDNIWPKYDDQWNQVKICFKAEELKYKVRKSIK